MRPTILIGEPRPHAGGNGIGSFLRFVLNYDALVPRQVIAVALWLAFAGLGWPVPTKLSFFAVEIYASLIVLRAVADVTEWEHLGRVLSAMWLPIGVLAVAGYLLFKNDQGRELGVGLMDLNAKGLCLGIVLVYWAFNNWLSGRIGLSRAFPEPKKEQFLLFWGPRLIGVAAHLLAAFSLSAAFFRQHDLQGRIEPLLVLTAPLAILMTTAFVWLWDYGFISERGSRQRLPLVKKLMAALAVFGLLLLVGLGYECSNNKVPSGFFLGTVLIAASAMFFLYLISRLRNKAPLEGATEQQREQDKREEQAVTSRWIIRLAVIMMIGTLLVWFWPMRFGQFVGSLNIACFAFACVLALANLLDLMFSRLNVYAKAHGFALRPGAIAAALICFLLLPAILTSMTQGFHRVRLCEQNQCTPAPRSEGWAAVADPAMRPTVSEAARAWYAQAEPAYHAIHPGEPVPMLIVATAGGGIRAAYWTATILETLDRELCSSPTFKEASTAITRNSSKPASDDKICNHSLMRNLLFAISGVSGGSVGAAAYAAAVQAHEWHSAIAIEPTRYLKEDFLAPGLASMIFIDGISNVLPDFGQIDRGQALELGFERASRIKGDEDGLVSHAFLSFFPALDAAATANGWRSALLFNATHQETGRRMITSHIKIERDVFVDSYDALQVLQSDLRMSTAAHNSARFTYVSPAGNLISPEPSHNRGYVIDGGYFENYGAETALELARKAIDAIDPGHLKVRPVVLQISSDPTLKDDRTLVRVKSADNGSCTLSNFGPAKPASADPANYLGLIDPVLGNANEGEGFVLSYANELSAPLVGIMTVREAHGTIAATALAEWVCELKRLEQARQASDASKAAEITGNISAAVTLVDRAPQFSHLAMCKESWNKGEVGVDPPLGWVLSDRTRAKFNDILKDCGNPDEMTALKKALGLPFPEVISAVVGPADHPAADRQDRGRGG